MKLKYDCLEYLKMQPQPWVQYQLSKILHEDQDSIQVKKELLLQCTEVQEMQKIVEEWPAPPLVRHNDVNHPLHKAYVLLDMGFDKSDPIIQNLAQKILKNQNADGVFLSLLHVPESYGGSKEPKMDWLMCDFPLLLHFLIETGYEEDARVQKGIDFLTSICQDNGWRCFGSVDKFRGPGRREDHCPIGTLWSLQVFSLIPSTHDQNFIKIAIDSICNHWKNTRERKIYMFAMGSDFRKLKYPNHWYDILHVIKVLSCFEYAREKESFVEMVKIVYDKQKSEGYFIPESIYNGYKGWDFAQKKNASATLTLEIWKIFRSFNM